MSQCASSTIRSWIRGAVLPRTAECPRVPPFVKTLTAFPKAARKAPGSTLAVVAKTVREAEAAWLQVILSPASFSPAGLYGGKLVLRGGGFTLTGYTVAPGVVVSGKLNINGPIPLGLTGTVHVAGPKAAAGALRITRTTLSGTLGGRRVSARL